MNCYIDKSGNRFFLINPIKDKCIYFAGHLNGVGFLSCREDELKNLLHREDGPAVELFLGKNFWYYHGQHINCQSQEEFEKILKMKAFL